MYVKKILCADSFSIESQFQESVWWSIKLRNRDSLLIGWLYRSPNSSDDNFNNMLQIFNQVKTEIFSHKLLMGDFNLREINWSDMTTTVNEQHKANLFAEAVRDSFLTQHAAEPTRI